MERDLQRGKRDRRFAVAFRFGAFTAQNSLFGVTVTFTPFVRTTKTAQSISILRLTLMAQLPSY